MSLKAINIIYIVIGLNLLIFLLLISFLFLSSPQSNKYSFIFRTYFLGNMKNHIPPSNFTGEFKTWFNNGNKLLEVNCVNGVYDGKYTGYYKDGSIAFKEYFKNGKKHGECQYWYNDGRLAYKGTYINGGKDGIHIFYGSEPHLGNLEEWEDFNPNSKIRIYKKGVLYKERRKTYP